MGAMRKCLSGLLCFLSLSNQMLAECPGDLDGSGTVKVADVLGLLSMFGRAEDCGESDLDGDDAGGVSDTLLVLGSFGQSCDANAPSVWADSTFEVLFEDNVVYGSGMSHDGWGGPVIDTIALELDVYAPDNQEEGRPALVVIHGGGFFGGSNEQRAFVELSNQYASRGWVVFSINYRLAAQRGTVPASWLDSVQFLPQGSNPNQALAMYPANRDAKAALRWVTSQADQYSIDVNHVSVLGGSAGACMAIAMGASNDGDYVTELSVMQDPTLQSTNLSESFQVQTVLDFWGGRASVDALSALDDEERFDSDNAPLMIVHGTADPTVDYAEATSLDATYNANGIPCTLYPIENGGHGIWGATVNGAQLWSLGFAFMVEQQGLKVEP
ncbi:MAG: hypothetical protein CBC05_04230 [Crocinitomicaceae bacterium TMED45]|nr:MAG: hypothetical protein CBC05_04230 [Crocinitomicaceae bacterium TMED45]